MCWGKFGWARKIFRKISGKGAQFHAQIHGIFRSLFSGPFFSLPSTKFGVFGNPEFFKAEFQSGRCDNQQHLGNFDLRCKHHILSFPCIPHEDQIRDCNIGFLHLHSSIGSLHLQWQRWIFAPLLAHQLLNSCFWTFSQPSHCPTPPPHRSALFSKTPHNTSYSNAIFRPIKITRNPGLGVCQIAITTWEKRDFNFR